jgi:demethylmenaquinone methyltransferase/2-methoxy-6-polyprenyl-1,4-benzoquinol methylase
MTDNTEKTHFGYQEIPVGEKTQKVAEVFHSVAQKYDLMNRLWKRFAIQVGQFRPGLRVLDLAGGTGDLTAKISPIVGETGEVVLSDINSSMLEVGRARLLDQGIYKNIKIVQANAEALPFPNNYFDRIIMGFGLRNVTNKQAALESMHRVLKPGGFLLVLEFSKTDVPGLKSLYDLYSFKILPKLGKLFAGDADSYQYLAESIRMHPDQKTLENMMQTAGFENCTYLNLSGGIVAIHKGYKF